MNFTDKHTIFAQIYSIASDFLSAIVEFYQEVILTPFPWSQWFRDTWAEFRILGNTIPGSNQFWYYATLEEWSTGKVILILLVSIWLYMVLIRFAIKLVREIIDIFT